MKRSILVFAAVLALAGAVACTSRGTTTEQMQPQTEDMQETEISLWAFPVGNWGNPTTVSGLLTSFHKEYPQIRVNVECVDYDSGDQKIREAVANGNAPDIVFEGPERTGATRGFWWICLTYGSRIQPGAFMKI